MTYQYGTYYHKPCDMTWQALQQHVQAHYPGFKLHKLRGDMFCLACVHCEGTSK